MEIKKVEAVPITERETVKLTEMGNITEIQYMSNRNKNSRIKLIGDKKYMDNLTGEIKEFKNHTSRDEHKSNLYKTFRNLRGIINTNVTDVNKCLWITLTYAENMTDSKRLTSDFVKFKKRFDYYSKSNNYEIPEYISVVEPQARGAWHVHLIFIYKEKAPFIANKKLATLWGKGFVKVGKLTNCDNVGAYLSAYLGDVELKEALKENIPIDEKNVIRKEIDGKSKQILKGGRLYLYPKGMNLYRCSKGIKKPIETYMSYEKAKKKVSSDKLTYKKNIQLSDNTYSMFLSQEYYNKIK